MWSADGRSALLRVRPQRRGEHLDEPSRGGAGQAGHAVHRRPRAVAVDLGRRPHDRLRARLRHLDARHGDGQAARGADHAARRAGRPGDRAPAPDQPVPGAGALARREEGRLRRARRDLRGLGEGRRRRGARDATAARASRSSPGRPTAGASSTCRSATASRTSSSTTSPPARRRSSRTGATGDARRASRRTASRLAFVRDGKELRVMDLGGEAGARRWRRAISPAPTRAASAWSPDGRWVAYLGLERQGRSPTSYVVPAAGGESRGRSASFRTPTRTRIAWSPDGTYLLFDTSQRTEDGPGRARGPDAAHAAVPRGSVPRSVQGERARRSPGQAWAEPAGADAATRAGRRRRRANRRSRSRSSSTTSAGALTLLPVGVDVERAGDQPGRQVAAARGDGGRAAEPLRLLARRAGARAGRSRAS